MTSSSVLPYFIHDRTTKPRVIATRLAHSSLQMTMRRSCGRSTSEIRWLRNERLARIEPARRRNRLIPFRAGYNRSNPSFFQITNRFDRTHARPERNSGATVRILMVVIEAITRWPSRCPLRVKLRRTLCEHMFSALPSNSDIARRIRHVSKVPQADMAHLIRPRRNASKGNCLSNTRQFYRPFDRLNRGFVRPEANDV